MSMTFHCPGAPTRSETCEWCVRARTDRDDRCALDREWVRDPAALTDAEWGRVTCDPWCSGSTTVSSGPEVNLSNANARDVLALLGLPTEDDWGSVQHGDIPAVLRRIMVAMNDKSARDHLVAEPVDRRAFDTPRIVTDSETGLSAITRGARLVFQGNTDANTLHRLERVREVFIFASTNGFSVSWG